MEALPFVRVVVINFDGGQMTIDCLQSLLATDYPADRLEIVLVDNGSLDDVVERVATEHPSVRVIEPLENTGFAGGCNLGIRAPGGFDHVALVNNDATVSPGWLRPLVDTLAADPGLGAACPKILFAERYQELELEVPDAGRIGRDPRTLGVRVSGVRLDGGRCDGRVQFDEGFSPPEGTHAPDREEMAVWSSAHGRIRFQVGDRPSLRAGLRVSTLSPRTLYLRSGFDSVRADRVLQHRWVDIRLDPTVHDVINNVGSNLYERGFGGDRGFLELDHGQFDEPADVFAWCGGAVLLSGRYLDEVGLFDERLFLYYEDTDLSWRGRLAGWNYRYVPSSIVRHRHAQSSVAFSPTFRYYTERNRVLVLAKNAPLALVVRSTLGLARRLVLHGGRDLLLRPLTLRLPVRAEVAHEWRVLRDVVTALPGMLRDRRRAATVVGRRSLMSWAVAK
ncbi:hypothetical protein BH23ACT3_BH23ACT3_21430 [soil metagenome]